MVVGKKVDSSVAEKGITSSSASHLQQGSEELRRQGPPIGSKAFHLSFDDD